MKLRKTKGVPSKVDIQVGARLRVIRLSRGLSQEKLAGLVDVTFQQIQKYERGTNRISAGRLYEMARVLGVEVQSFFDEGGSKKDSVHKTNDNTISPRLEDLSKHEMDLIFKFRNMDKNQQTTLSSVANLAA